MYAKARTAEVAQHGKLLTSNPQVTVDDIEGYERTYRGSAEEERDLKVYFARFVGDMSQCVPAKTPAHLCLCRRLC